MKPQNVIVEKIYPARDGKNQDFVTLQLRSKVVKESGSGLQSMLLGGNFEENRVAFQSMQKARLEKFGITEGCNLSAKIGVGVRLTVEENTTGGLGFQPKINPQTGEILTKAGQTIYRKVSLTDLNEPDTYVEHDTVATAAAQATSVEEQAAIELHG